MDYSQAFAFAPADGGLLIDRGKIFRSQSKFDQAIQDFSRALEIDATRWPAGYRERGLTYARIGAREAAQEVILALQAVGGAR